MSFNDLQKWFPPISASPKIGVIIERLTDAGLSIEMINDLTVEQAKVILQKKDVARVHIVDLAEDALALETNIGRGK